MKFEDWGPAGYGVEDFSHAEKSAIRRMYADWKAERVFYLLQNKDLEEANNSMGPKMIKLIGALVKAAVPLEAINISVEWELADSIKWDIQEAIDCIRAVLAEVKDQS